MLYPQNGNIAMGSRRTTPTFPVMAAVVSVLMAEPRKTPWVQSNASNTSGITAERREPKTNPEMGTPCGSSQLGAIDGHCDASTVNRELGCAAGPLAGDRKSTRLNSSHLVISYAVFCLKKKNQSYLRM